MIVWVERLFRRPQAFDFHARLADGLIVEHEP